MDVDYKIDQLFHVVCHHGLAELKDELFYIFEAALKGHSGLARNQLMLLEGKIDAAVLALTAPPDEEEMALHHPFYDV